MLIVIMESYALRYRLLGANCHKALKALKYIEDVLEQHAEARPSLKFRKDGVTPAQMHQIQIAHFAITLKGVDAILDDLVCTILLHDVMEDFDVPMEEILAIGDAEVYNAVWNVTKKYRGVTKKPEDVFNAIAKNLLSALAKGCDRIDNFQSMSGAFTTEKQLSFFKHRQNIFYAYA